MKKRIYIAGCGGMLGKAFYENFKDNYELKCTDKDVNEDWLTFLDFRDESEYKKDVVGYQPDILIHLGALTDLEYCESNREDAYNSNYQSVIYATHLANELNIPLLYISTAGIYDGKKEVYDERDLPIPLSVYGDSKYKGELHVLNNAKMGLVCRAGWMMGGGPKKDKKFINKIMNQIKGGAKELFIVNDKDGTPTYTKDFAKNSRLLLEKEQTGLFNMVCDGLTLRTEVAEEMLRILNLQDEITIHEVNSDYFSKEYSAPRPRSERLINRRLNELNLNVMRDWRVCLKEYLETEFIH